MQRPAARRWSMPMVKSIRGAEQIGHARGGAVGHGPDIGNRRRAFELTGAWAASADQCGKVFIRKGRANEIAFTALSDRNGGGFIVEANRIRGKFTTCMIKSRKDDGQTL